MKGTTGVFVFGLGCLLVYSILPASHLPADDKSVLITGCDTGFGQALAKKLDAIGVTVFAGCLYSNGPGAIELFNSCSARLRVVQLDVCNPAEIQQAHSFIKEQTRDEGLWGLVNSASMWHMAELEMTSTKTIQQILEVNVLGLISVTNQFLPMIRKCQGRVVNVSSSAGRVPFECLGAYSITKHAVEAYSDVLRMEMKKWGVSVSTIQPLAFQTASWTEQNLQLHKEEIWKNMSEESQQAYGQTYLDEIYNIFKVGMVKVPTDLTPVVRAMRSGLLSKRPRPRYPCGLGAETLLTVIPLLPVWLSEKFLTAFFAPNKDVRPSALKNPL